MPLRDMTQKTHFEKFSTFGLIALNDVETSLEYRESLMRKKYERVIQTSIVFGMIPIVVSMKI